MHLPEINKLIYQSQSLALCDLVFMPEWEYRYFSL